MKESTEDEIIFSEKVHQLYINAPIGLIATLINAFILGFILRSVVPLTFISYWLIALIITSFFRASFVYLYRRSPHAPDDAKRWNNWFNLNMAVSGTIWGAAAIYLFPTESIAHQVFLVFVLGGMVAGMAGTFAVNLVTFISFSLPAFVPISFRFFLVWDDIHIAIGMMSALFYILMFFTARRVNVSNSLAFKLKHENEGLVRHLQQAKDRSERYNEELLQEIEERVRIEEELKNHKENLEELVKERTNALSLANINLEKEISERIDIQKALQESEEKYRLLVDNANDAIIIIQDETIRFVNHVACAVSGYTEDELIGKSIKNFVHEDDVDMKITRYVHSISDSSNPEMYSLRIYSKDGDAIWVQNNAVLIDWEGRPALLNILRDISLIRKLENQLHHRNKMEAIGTLAGGIAHDFNNILAIISGNVELVLLDLAPDDKFRSYIDHIRKAVQRAKNVVKQILSFSRKGEFQEMPINIRETIEETLTLLRVSLPSSIKISMDIAQMNETVMADSTQIHQLIMNLCTNAADAMADEGEIVIRLRKIKVGNNTVVKHPDLPEGDYVCLNIKDNGHGMDPNTMGRIFEPYFTTKKPGKGTGMGLALCYGIVKSHNGAISVDSEVGKGTVFEILLPCHSGPVVTMLEKSPEFSNGNGERILFVDDEEDIAQVGGDMLEKMGYHTDIETDPVKALNHFNEQPNTFDLVITDMTMPNINGIRLAEILKSIRPDIPIIITSGYSDIIDRSDLGHMDQTIFLQKPYTMETLGSAVRKIIKQ